MPQNGSTPNFALVLPYGNRQNWTDLANGNFRTIDALLATFVSVTNLKGLWTNNTAYIVGDNVVDETAGVVYTALVANTSSSPPTTFVEERAAHPTYWTTFAVAARSRGVWQTATAYSLNDFVLADGTKYAMAIAAHTSGASFTTDLAAGKWTVLIDLSTAGSLVLPVLSGAADANKIVMTDSGGTSYIINSVATLASLLNAAGLATLANPAFTGNPSGPTQAAEDNDTSLATTQYADRAVRNLVIRRQVFIASGTYTPHPKLIYCDIMTLGCGGGGAGTANQAAANAASGGGGGGAGSVSRVSASAATIGASQTVTIGAAGTAGAAGANNGGNGGDASVGVLCIGKGGTGGTSVGGKGGLGGIAGTGDDTSTGQNGFSQIILNNVAGEGSAFGGSSPHGGGGFPGNTTTGTGNAGTGNGSGGGGGISFNNNGAWAGGAGTVGKVVIIEYCYG